MACVLKQFKTLLVKNIMIKNIFNILGIAYIYSWLAYSVGQLWFKTSEEAVLYEAEGYGVYQTGK